MFMDCTTEDVLAALIRHVGAGDEEDMLRRLHIDCRWCTCTQDFQPVNVYAAGTYVDLWGVEKTLYGGIPVKHPLAHAETLKDLEDYPTWPTPDQIDFDALIRRMEMFPDYCVFGGMWGPFAEQAMLMIGFEKYMTMMIEAPAMVDFLLEKTCAFYMQCDQIIFERVRAIACKSSSWAMTTADNKACSIARSCGGASSSRAWREFTRKRSATTTK